MVVILHSRRQEEKNGNIQKTDFEYKSLRYEFVDYTGLYGNDLAAAKVFM